MTALATLQGWMKKNPFQESSLPAYTNTEKARNEQESVQKDGWSKHIVMPSTPLSAILLMQDDIYASSPITARNSHLRDETTTLQERAVTQLKGRAWPMRKTAEGIASVGLEEERHSLWTPIGYRALCNLRECQLVVLQETTHVLTFYPEDVRCWSKDIPVYILDSYAHMIHTPPESFTLISWLLQQEANFAIEWPEQEGTMEELKAIAGKIGESTAKIVKASLQKKIGRTQSINALKEWSN